MSFISLELTKDITLSTDESVLINLLTHIASSTSTILTYFEVETASIILAKILQKIYNSIPYCNLLEDVNTKKYISVSGRKIYVADRELFLVILLNSIRKSDEFSKTKIIKIPEPIITNFLSCLNIEKKYTALLLRSLNYILLKTNYISPSLCEKIIVEMQKVGLSPITGFKRYACEVSRAVLPFLHDDTKKLLCNIDLIPVKSLDTIDLVTLYSTEFVKANKILILKKICLLFQNNVENKDGEALYKRLISFYSFDNWKEEIWPILLPYLKNIDASGEFFQSLLKYWITTNVKQYKADFYYFMEIQPIDNVFKVHTYLETCRNGFISEYFNREHFYDIRTVNLQLRIISTYYKKTLVPQQMEKKIFMEFLYSNINYFLDNEVIKSMEMFLSQLFLYAHSDLKKGTKQVEVYSEFLYKLYKFCHGILVTELFEVGVQVLQILLNIAKGGHKNLRLGYKLEKIDFYEEGENLLYNKLKIENQWSFEDDKLISTLNLCLAKNQGCSRLLIDVIKKHYPISSFINIELFEDILTSAETEPSLQSYDKISNLSLLLFNHTDDEDLKKYVDKLTEELMLIIDNENMHSGNILHKATLRIIILVNAYDHSLLVKDYDEIIHKCFATFKELLVTFSTNSTNSSLKFRSVKILESFINNVTYGLGQHLEFLWDNLDKEFIVRSIIKIIEKSNMRRPVMLNEDLLKKFSNKMEMQEDDKLLKMKILEETLEKLFLTEEYKDYKIRRNPETRLVLHALCLHEKSSEKPLLRRVLRFLLQVLNDTKSSEESLTAAFHCLEIFVSNKTLHENTLEFIPEIIRNSVEGFVSLSWAVRNANLQLTKALIERLYGVSLGLWNRPKDISDLFQLYPQLTDYFFNILSSENLDERAHIVFQYFLESQVKDNIFSQTFITISQYFQQLFINIIKEYEHHYGKLAVHSFVAICRVEYIPAVICDIKEYIKKNIMSIRKNILSNLILLLQELYYKFRKSFQCLANPENITIIQNYLQDLAYYLKLCNLPHFYPILFDITSVDVNLNKVQFLNCSNSQQDRRWLHNNIHFLLLHSKPNDVANVCSVLFSHNLPNFAQYKMLSILIYRLEKLNFEFEDVKNILEVLFKSTVNVNDKDIFMLESFLRVITVFGNILLETNITMNLRIELVISDSLYRNLIYLVYKVFNSLISSDEDLSSLTKQIESQIIKFVGVSEETDNDILSALIYFHKISNPKNLFNFFKLIFYFCTNESTYLGAYYLVSYIMAKKYCSILSLLVDFFCYDHLSLNLKETDIAVLYEDLNILLEKESESSHNINTFYEVEGDELIPSDILKILLRSLQNRMYLDTKRNHITNWLLFETI